MPIKRISSKKKLIPILKRPSGLNVKRRKSKSSIKFEKKLVNYFSLKD